MYLFLEQITQFYPWTIEFHDPSASWIDLHDQVHRLISFTAFHDHFIWKTVLFWFTTFVSPTIICRANMQEEKIEKNNNKNRWWRYWIQVLLVSKLVPRDSNRSHTAKLSYNQSHMLQCSLGTKFYHTF
jgi:hypothetical protein